jgi:polar amino acid transport system substrate-binding protein
MHSLPNAPLSARFLPGINRMKSFMLFVSLMLFALGFSGCGESARANNDASSNAKNDAPKDMLSTIKERKEVRVGVVANNQPFSYQIGKEWTGFDIEIAQGIANNLGIEKVTFVPVTLDTRSDAVVNGQVDMVVASMTITRYRERRVDFSLPYFQDGQALLVPTSSPIKSYIDLNGKKVGAVKGSTSSFYMKQINPDATVKTYPDNAALLVALAAGEIDALTGDYLVLLGMRVNAKNAADLRIAGDRMTVEPYGIAVAQNQSAWRNAINHALIALWEKQDWHASADTWFGRGSKYASPINFVMPVYPK